VPVAIGTILFVDLLMLLAKSGNGAVAGVMSFIAVILLVIVFHEFGHFLTAKAFGIKVTEFFVGFGPRVWSVRKGETEYGIKAIPAGGYVRIAGMNPLTEEPPEDYARTFGAKPAWQRLIVLVSGAATHFILAFVLLIVYFGAIGMPRYAAVIGGVEKKLDGQTSPAAAAGIQPGDRVITVDGRPVDGEEFITYTRSHVGEPIEIVVERDGERRQFVVRPVLSEVAGQKVGRLGVVLTTGEVVSRERVGPLTAVGDSASLIGRGTVDSLKAVGRVFGPEGIGRLIQLLKGDQRTLDDPVGLVGAGRLAGQAVAAGQFDAFFGLFISFNIFVGLLNLLPVPPLDGGHVLLLGIEKVRGRPVDLRRVIPVMAVVAGFLILYTITLLYVDIRNPIPNPFR
jgi:membrane-associated protease RseP (regulator of RpoE activity)